MSAVIPAAAIGCDASGQSFYGTLSLTDSMKRRTFDKFLLLFVPLTYTCAFAWGLLRYLRPIPEDVIDELDIGPLEDIPIGAAPQAVHFNRDVVLVHRPEADKVVALNAKCTHLGCNVKWDGKEEDFWCTCHGARFAADGRVTQKPAEEDLVSQPWQLVDGNVVILRKGKSTT